jgi:hypothetical protein
MLIAMVLIVGLVGGGCAALGRQALTEVALLAAGEIGEEIFTNEPGLGDDEHGIEDPGDGGRVNGDSVGLYGGTTRKANCDRNKLIEFLERPENADKAEAWAQVLGIPRSGIRGYIRALTPFILRHDTMVKNHGFKNGKATVFHAILEAGIAVLVDQLGSPKVRCACGNPLTSPDVDANSEIAPKGTEWKGFRKERTTVVDAGKKIDTFTFQDIQDKDRRYVSRKPGTDGTDDRVQPPPHPRLELSESSVEAGGTSTATATDFAPGEQVRFSRTGPSEDPIDIDTVEADSHGRATTKINAEAEPDKYTITAKGLRSGRTASASLTVVGPEPTSGPGSEPTTNPESEPPSDPESEPTSDPGSEPPSEPQTEPSESSADEIIPVPEEVPGG